MALDYASAEATSLLPGVKANESGDTPDDQVAPVGDNGKAGGDYQVHAGAVQDVNKAFGTNYTWDDTKDKVKGKDIAQKYLTLQVQRFGPRVGLEAYNAGPTRVAAGDVPQAAVDYASRALNVGGAGNMDALGADAGQFKQMLGTPDASWLQPLIGSLNASRTAEKAELEGVRRQQDEDYTTDRARVKDAFDRTQKDDTTPWTQKPPPPETLQAFASAGSIFAAIASAFTRTPAISAMNGMAAAINARRDGNQKAYEDAYQVWQANTKLAIERQHEASERLTEALQLMTTDSAHGFAQARQIMQEHGDDRALAMLEAGEYQKVGEANDARNAAALNMALQNQKILHPTAKPQILTDPGTKDADGNPVQYIWNQGVTGPGQYTTLAGQPFTPKGAARMASGGGGALISDDAATLAADRFLAGDKSATVGFGRSPQNLTKITEAITRLAKDRGMDGAEIAQKTAEFAGAMSAERALGTRTANMEIAANEVKTMAPLALSASKVVDRTQYPSLNSVLLAAEKGTGDENVVRFGLAANSLIYTYAKFLNPTGIPTDSDKARATEILSTAWTKGQFAAAIDQIRKEIASGQSAVKSTKEEIGEGVTGRPTGASAPSAQPAPTPTASAPQPLPPRDQLKAGVTYQTPRGLFKYDGEHFIPAAQ